MAVNEVAIEVSEAPAPEVRTPDSGSWRSDSVCRTYPTRWWFAGDYRESTRAKEICADCVVSSACLEYALSRPDLLGIWAATTPNERAAMRRDRRAGIAPAVAAAPGGGEGPRRGAVVAPEVVAGPDAVAAIGRDEPRIAAPEARVEVDLEFEAAIDAELAAEFAAAAHDREAAEPAVGAWPTAATAHLTVSARDGDELLTPAEAGAKLGVTPNTVTRWSRAGKLSAIQTMGGHRRFRRSEIERVLRDANRGPSEPQRPQPTNSGPAPTA